MKLIEEGFLRRFTCILCAALVLFVIPVRSFSNEYVIVAKSDQQRENSIVQEKVGLGVDKQKRSEFEDYHRGEKALSDDAGYVIIGVLAIGLAVVVILIVKNISNSTKIPDP